MSRRYTVFPMPISDLVRNLLQKRGIETEESISAFLNPDYEAHTHSPFLLADMGKAVERVFEALEKDERIAVYADFDCDGIPGAALLLDFFKKVGHANIESYLPHRDREGYGLHTEALDALRKRGAGLVITVDVGTTAHEAIAHARARGVDVIVTDHHELSEGGKLPDAYAILNPMRPGAISGQAPYPFPHICGAAVAWKLVQALLIEGRRRRLRGFTEIPAGWEKWLLDLVGIATIADMVPLTGENRVLARYGLSVLRKSRRPGLIALIHRLRLRKEELTEDDIGFSLAPRINAASRMGEPDLALRLLTTNDGNEAEHLAAHLDSLNTRRKALVGSIVREAKKRVRERSAPTDRVIVIGNPDWKPALLGLAANSILDGERRLSAGRQVVCIWGRDAKGRLKGSCRTDGSISIMELFANAPGCVEEYGGHAASGGFTVSHQKVHLLHEALAEAAAKIEMSAAARESRGSDALMTVSGVSPSLFKDVSLLAPFGMGNPKPVFLISDAVVASLRRFGKEKNHLELTLRCVRTGFEARAFDFFRSPENFTHAPEAGKEARILATIERDSYRGASAIALRIVDILPAR